MLRGHTAGETGRAAQRITHRTRDFVAHRFKLAFFTVELLRPDRRTTFGIQQRRQHTQSAVDFAQRAMQQISGAQLLPCAAEIDIVLITILADAAPTHHRDPGRTDQRGRNFVAQASRQLPLQRVTTDTHEREHRNRCRTRRFAARPGNTLGECVCATRHCGDGDDQRNGPAHWLVAPSEPNASIRDAVLQRRKHFTGGLWTTVRIFLEALRDQPRDRRRYVRSPERHRRRLCAHVRRNQLMLGQIVKRRMAGEHLICDASKRIDVRAVIRGRITDRLLRCDIGRRPDSGTGLRECRCGAVALRSTDGLRDAKVCHDCGVTGQHHVIRLHVAMHHTMLVRVRQRARHIAQNAHTLRNRKRFDCVKSFAQRRPFLERHDEIEHPVGVP